MKRIRINHIVLIQCKQSINSIESELNDFIFVVALYATSRFIVFQDQFVHYIDENQNKTRKKSS